MDSGRVVFFDLGDTLGAPKLSPPPHVSLIGFNVFDYVPEILGALRRRSGMRLGVISNTGNDTHAEINPILARVGILPEFDPTLIFYSGDGHPRKDSPVAFENVASHAGHQATADRCVFVGEDATERLHARSAFGTAAPGMSVCPHPLLVGEVLDGEPLRFVVLRITDPNRSVQARATLRSLPFVALKQLGGIGVDERIVGITSSRVAMRLIDMRFGVEYLGQEGDPDTNDLFLLRDDEAEGSGFLASRGQLQGLARDRERRACFVGTDDAGLFVTIAGDQSVEDFHFDVAAHGHNLKLLPDTTLLSDRPTQFAASTVDAVGVSKQISECDLQSLSSINKDAIRKRVESYSGIGASGGLSPIHSRHIHHEDNRTAVARMANEFSSLGNGVLTVSLHQFTHEGRTLHNVVAELPGARSNAGIVLVTAHLDSTAASSSPYTPSSDVAPGADDDASGVAGVIAIAECLIELSKTAGFERTVQFVLFNAEEHGLVGSQAYARSLASSAPQTSVVAVFQMDMIGYNVLPPRSWEVHAGYSLSQQVEQRSVELAEIIQALTPTISPNLKTPQLYQTRPALPSPQRDPAEGRSDHASFHKYGYAACVVSEDFFPGPAAASPAPEANPNYHRKGDDFVDYEYAADIARVIAGAAVAMARKAITNSLSRTSSTTASVINQTKGDSTMPLDIDIRTQALQRSAQLSSTTDAASIRDRLKSQALPPEFGDSTPEIAGTMNALTGTPRKVKVAAFQAQPNATDDAIIEHALSAVQTLSRGFTDSGKQPSYFPDSYVPKTSANACVVNLHQHYRGIQVFQMTETVRFSSKGLEVIGDTVIFSDVETSVVPTLPPAQAAEVAIKHLAKSLNGRPAHSHWGPSSAQFNLDVSQLAPKVTAVFAMPNRPTVLQTPPFDSPIAAHLVWFYAGKDHQNKQQLLLGWFLDITTPGASAQFHVIVGAGDDQKGNVLYATEASRSAADDNPAAAAATVSGNVYETNPGPDINIDARQVVQFPRPVGDYPLPPAVMPLPAEFPKPWVDSDETVGHSTDGKVVVREFPRQEQRVKGASQGGNVVFDISTNDRLSGAQQGLNEFYFCNYMYDFFYILGFREADGNFSANDPVNAFAHPRPVFGTANMLTPVDGLSPTMNMGLVAGGINRHTAFDADVVFHEFLHGVTNRLVGGGNNSNALDAAQSGMQGEGWGDYFALTIQNFGQPNERTTTGDWVTNSPGRGIRRFPYTDGYPEDFGDIRPGGTTQVHAGGEIWCATLMHMTRLMGRELNNVDRGYHIAWQIVVDALKLSPTNPSFLDSRDAILDALDDLRDGGTITPPERDLSRRAIWTAFAGFGMGPNASSLGASIFGVQADFNVPNEPAIGLHGITITRPRDTQLQPNAIAADWAASDTAALVAGRQLSVDQKLAGLPEDKRHTLLAIVDAYLASQR